MADHEHGSMDISEQEKTFARFMAWSAAVGGISAVVLLFLWITVV